MVKIRDEPKKTALLMGQMLKNFLLPHTSEREAEATKRRLTKAVYGSLYTEDQFEKALDQHRRKMLELGETINDLINEFGSQWQKGRERGQHRGYGNRAVAKTYIKRVMALQERIDKHLEMFERKLAILTSWRQYKIENDIGSEVDATEVKEFIANEYDRHEIEQTTFDEKQAEQIIESSRTGTGGDVVTEDEQELFDKFAEKEFGDTIESESETDDENINISESVGGGSSGNGTSDDDVVDEEVEEFIKQEFN